MVSTTLAWGIQLLYGALYTLGLSLGGFILGLIIGILMAIFSFSKHYSLKIIFNFYTLIIRSLPELMVIYLLFYGGNGIIAVAFVGQAHFASDAITMGIIALALISGTYSCEVIRGALLAIPKGQIEVAIAMGMNKPTIFMRVLLPQLIFYALPGLVNCWLLTIKDSALLSVIGISEIMFNTNLAVNSTNSPFLFYFIAGLIYLFFTYISALFLKKVSLHYAFIKGS